MSSIEMRKPHGTTAEDAAARSRALFQAFVDRRPELFKRVDWARDGRSADVKGKGFTGKCIVDDARVSVTIKLGFIARPFRSKIEASLNRRFDAEFGG